MTSGLFNTGGPGDSAAVEITSITSAVQPDPSDMFKCMDPNEDFSAEIFDPNFDMNMFGDLGDAGFDPLGDASLDSFTDLSAFLSENTFLDQLEDENPVSSVDCAEVSEEATATVSSKSIKRSFDEMQSGSSSLDNLSENMGLTTMSTHDHDYSSKRPRMSDLTEEPSFEDLFLAPAPISAPTPSTSCVITEAAEKSLNRREKNNVASKRSREIRKQKFLDLEAEAERLINENAHLEKRVVELERMAKQMREILVAKMAGK